MQQDSMLAQPKKLALLIGKQVGPGLIWQKPVTLRLCVGAPVGGGCPTRVQDVAFFPHWGPCLMPGGMGRHSLAGQMHAWNFQAAEAWPHALLQSACTRHLGGGCGRVNLVPGSCSLSRGMLDARPSKLLAKLA